MLRLLFAAILLLTPAAAQRFGQLTRTYLGLSEDQNSQLREIVEPYSQWTEAQRTRVRQVEGEIQDEALKTPLDPMALGLRYAELESIRRESVDRLADVIRQRRALLTPDQIQRLEVLEEARRLGDTVEDANCEHLLQIADPSNTCGVIYVSLSTPATPATPPVPIPESAFPPDPTAPLRQYLELTREQSVAYLQNVQTLGAREREIKCQISRSEGEAADALAASPLSPARIGFAKADSIAARRKIDTLYQEAVNLNSSLLTPSQLSRLRVLEGAQALADAATLAQRYALLLPWRSSSNSAYVVAIIRDPLPFFCAIPAPTSSAPNQ